MYSVNLDWQGGRAFHATGSLGVPVALDLPESSGGQGKGMRPFELLLSALAYCAAIDVVDILEKQRQPIIRANIRVDATTRREGELSTIDTAILIFTVDGPEKEKLERAIQLSLQKYCSVAGMFGHFCDISYRIDSPA